MTATTVKTNAAAQSVGAVNNLLHPDMTSLDWLQREAGAVYDTPNTRKFYQDGRQCYFLNTDNYFGQNGCWLEWFFIVPAQTDTLTLNVDWILPIETGAAGTGAIRVFDNTNTQVGSTVLMAGTSSWQNSNTNLTFTASASDRVFKIRVACTDSGGVGTTNNTQIVIANLQLSPSGAGLDSFWSNFRRIHLDESNIHDNVRYNRFRNSGSLEFMAHNTHARARFFTTARKMFIEYVGASVIGAPTLNRIEIDEAGQVPQEIQTSTADGKYIGLINLVSSANKSVDVTFQGMSTGWNGGVYGTGIFLPANELVTLRAEDIPIYTVLFESDSKLAGTTSGSTSNQSGIYEIQTMIVPTLRRQFPNIRFINVSWGQRAFLDEQYQQYVVDIQRAGGKVYVVFLMNDNDWSKLGIAASTYIAQKRLVYDAFKYQNVSFRNITNYMGSAPPIPSNRFSAPAANAAGSVLADFDDADRAEALTRQSANPQQDVITIDQAQIGQSLVRSSGLTSQMMADGLHPTVYGAPIIARNLSRCVIAPRAPTATKFIPTDIGSTSLYLWFDGQDGATQYQDSALTTLVTASGQSVGGWKDKSGNATHVLQATAGKQPTAQFAASNLNGHRGIQFATTGDNTLRELVSSASIHAYGANAGWTIYLVCAFDGTGNTLEVPAACSSGAFGIRYVDAGNHIRGVGGGTQIDGCNLPIPPYNGAGTAAGTTGLATPTGLKICRMQLDKRGSLIALYIDGFLQTTFGSGLSDPASFGTMRIGSLNGTNDQFVGAVGEFLLISPVVSSSLDDQIFQYLWARWKL